MKKLFYSLITTLIVIGISSCGTEPEQVEDNSNDIKDTTQIVENESGEVVQIKIDDKVDAKEAVEEAVYSGGKNLMGETKEEAKEAVNEINTKDILFGEWTLEKVKVNGTELPVEFYDGFKLEFIEPFLLKRTKANIEERFNVEVKDENILDIDNNNSKLYKILNIKTDKLLIEEKDESGVTEFLLKKEV